MGHLQKMCKSMDKSGDGSEKQKNPEVGQFEEKPGYKSMVCDIVDEAKARVGDAGEQINTWLGDSGSSHHIVSSSAGMINVTKCPPGMRIQ